jgi:hypothetical protein
VNENAFENSILVVVAVVPSRRNTVKSPSTTAPVNRPVALVRFEPALANSMPRPAALHEEAVGASLCRTA